MLKAAFKWLIFANVVIGFNTLGWAQETDPFSARWAQNIDAGEMEYLSSCAACHGTDGKGRGALSVELKAKPADLTVLAKKNNGAFPVGAVSEVIDGRKSVSAHGPREMPVWGFRYMPSPNEALGPTATDKYLNLSYNLELEVRSRILTIIDYLNRIQEK